MAEGITSQAEKNTADLIRLNEIIDGLNIHSGLFIWKKYEIAFKKGHPSTSTHGVVLSLPYTANLCTGFEYVHGELKIYGITTKEVTSINTTFTDATHNYCFFESGGETKFISDAQIEPFGDDDFSIKGQSYDRVPGEFLGYSSSDFEDDFPENGIQDEYWYERVKSVLSPLILGCTKIAVDTVTKDSRVKAETLNHSLGETPKIAILISPIRTHVQNDLYGYFAMNINSAVYTGYCHMVGSSSDYVVGGGAYLASLMDSNTVSIGSKAYYFTPNVEYTLITIA